jgi:hypothetical protein
MSEPKASTSNTQITFETYESTLAKRVLNSNLSDEDKIVIIQLIGNHQNIISIPSIWKSEPQFFHEHGTDSPKRNDYTVTCSLKNEVCPHTNVPYLDDNK